MPDATNTLLACEVALWNIALAWPALVTQGSTGFVKAGNRIRLDQIGIKWPEVAKSMRQAADAPELKLEIGAVRPDPTAPRTFCTQPTRSIAVYDWTVSGSDKTYNVVTQVISELKAAMFASGLQLGQSAIVHHWEWEIRPGKADVKDRQMIFSMRVWLKG